MLIPADKIEIPSEKIKNYLLLSKKKNDKSAFLNKLGYTMENWNDLANDIKTIVASNEALLQQKSAYGDIYEVKGKLKDFNIITIWLQKIGAEKYNFITLFPDKKI